MQIADFRLNRIFAFFALTILFTIGCRSEASQTAGSAGVTDLSGPPVMSPFWGARMPRICARVTSPPNAAQATALIQCHMDHETREAVFLMQNVKIQMTGSHAVGAMDGSADNIDNSSKVYDLHGSNDFYNCAPINESVMHNTGRTAPTPAATVSTAVAGRCMTAATSAS